MSTLTDWQYLRKRPKMTAKSTIYKSFLIRFWSETPHSTLRVMVTRINESGEQYYFATLDDLMMFLLKEFENRSNGELPII
jgi:hypothetical protein